MSCHAVFLPAAEQDINGIEEYLAQFYAGTVRDFFTELKKRVLELEDMPYIRPVYEDDPYFRWMVVNSYLLFYSVDEKRRLVVIHRIFHSKRDVSQQILKRLLIK